MGTAPDGAVIITTADIYRQVVELNAKLGELKGALEALGAMVNTVGDHETRLRVLERKTAVAVPALGTISLGGVAAALVQLFSGG